MAESRESPLAMVQGDHTSDEREEWIQKASVEELIELLQLLSPHSPLASRARAAIDARVAGAGAQPRYVWAPLYAMVFAALILAGISAWPVIRDWTRGGSGSGLEAAPPRIPETNSNPSRAP